MKPVVVKIGGSVLAAGRLRAVLDVVVNAGRAAVIVAGGGAFADAVRKAQKQLGFSDPVAHRMAVLAMHQSAEIVLAANAAFMPVETLRGIRNVHEKRQVCVWLPARMVLADRTIATDWSVTSDALAARLAERLGGADVILIKSCAVSSEATADQLASDGIVDTVFPRIVERADVNWRALESSNLTGLTEALAYVKRKKAIRRVGKTMLSRDRSRRS